MLDKVKNSPHRVAITSACIIITAAIFFYVFYATIPVNWWRELCEKLIFPAIAAISGGLTTIWAGSEIFKPFLETYLERTGYGLTKRKIYFRGNEALIKKVKENLQFSNLIEPKNYSEENITLEDADIAILCIEKKELLAKNPEQVNQDGNKQENQQTIWEEQAHKLVLEFIDEIETSNQDKHCKGLIVYTADQFARRTANKINDRSFSILVNSRGRIVSDIHSLLTTLPPRSGE